MATIPGLSHFLTHHYLVPLRAPVLAPRGDSSIPYRLPARLSQTERFDRLDWADQKELVDARRLPNIPATMQPTYAELIEAARVREGRWLPADGDFADRFHERRQELARFAPDARNDAARSTLAHFAEILSAARATEARFERIPREPPPPEIGLPIDTAPQLDALLNLSVLLLLWRNNPLQFPTGARLDLLI